MKKNFNFEFKPRTEVFKRYFSVYIIFILLIASFLIGLLIGQKTGGDQFTNYQEKYLELKKIPSYLSKQVDPDLYRKIWDSIKADYVNKQELTDEQLFYGSLEGLVNSLKDPYSQFFDPETAQKFQEDLSGKFDGIGAEIGIKNNILTIVAPLSETPAEKSGLMAGDLIVAINGEDTTGISIDEAVSKIRGEHGTQVVLTIYREGFEQPKDFSITRGKIEVPSVEWEMKNEVGYIQIYHFNSETSRLFNDAVKELLSFNPHGIILDLRNNPGGYLDSAVDISSYWIDQGIVVYERFSDGTEIKYPSSGKALLKDMPTVVLINQGSASGSEIVAGALQDLGKATLVGQTTFGKGSVQNYEEYDDGSAMKLTVASWYTPNNRQISEIGISPDIEMENTIEDYNNDLDPQFDKALEILK